MIWSCLLLKLQCVRYMHGIGYHNKLGSPNYSLSLGYFFVETIGSKEQYERVSKNAEFSFG